MLLLLSVPFRTCLNLNPRFAASRIGAFVEALAGVAQQMENEWENLRVKVSADHDQDGRGLYTHIDEDFLPACVQPLFTVEWVTIAELDVAPEVGWSGGSVKLEDVSIHFYDHTLAILEMRLILTGITNRIDTARSLDQWTVELAKVWIQKAAPMTESLEAKLSSATLSQRTLSLPIGSEDAYFDRAGLTQRQPALDLLWVSRVMVLEGDAVAEDWLQAWTQDPLSSNDRIAIGQSSAALRVGNSVIFDRCDDVGEASVMRALRLCNRFYSIAHVLSNNQRLVHAQLLSEEIRSEQAASISSSVRSHLDLLMHEYEDTKLGIQGLRRQAVQAYMRAWEFDKLISICERRLASVDAFVQSAFQRRNLRYTKLVEATLTLIGCVALLDFALNLLNFSRIPELANDALPGLLDLARLIPPDGLLYVLMALIAYLVYGKLKR